MIQVVAARHPDLAWRFAQARQKELAARMDRAQQLSFAPSLLGSASDARLADQLRSYAQRTFDAGGRRASERIESRVRHRARVRSERLPEIDRWLQLGRTRSDAPAEAA